MRKRELVQAVATHTDVDPKVAAKVVDGMLEVILATVSKGEDVALTGFAKFSKVKRAARTARNPATGEPVKVKAKTVARITPLKGFKDVVLGTAPAPKLTKASGAAAKKKAAPAKATATAGTTKKAATAAAPARQATKRAPAGQGAARATAKKAGVRS